MFLSHIHNHTQSEVRWIEVKQWWYHGNTGCAPNVGGKTPMLSGSSS